MYYSYTRYDWKLRQMQRIQVSHIIIIYYIILYAQKSYIVINYNTLYNRTYNTYHDGSIFYIPITITVVHIYVDIHVLYNRPEAGPLIIFKKLFQRPRHYIRKFDASLWNNIILLLLSFLIFIAQTNYRLNT